MTLTIFRRSQVEQASGGQAKRSRPRIGLVLGAGVARGWAHIGALRELTDLGIVPDVIVGASIGAVVGGCFAAGRLDGLEDFARSLTRRSVFNLVDVSFRGCGLDWKRRWASSGSRTCRPASSPWRRKCERGTKSGSSTG